jgi:hypothetical protein
MIQKISYRQALAQKQTTLYGYGGIVPYAENDLGWQLRPPASQLFLIRVFQHG